MIHASSIEDRWVAVKNLRITVVYEECSRAQVESSIEPLSDDNGVYSSTALSEYESFLISALDVFDDHDFEIIQEKGQPLFSILLCCFRQERPSRTSRLQVHFVYQAV